MLRYALVVVAIGLLTRPALAEDEAPAIEVLYSSIAADLAAGRPLVVQVHVPLCEKSIIKCGNTRLGDGDNPDSNLYWSTRGGFKGWFTKARGWRLVHAETPATGEVLEKRVWRRTVRAVPAWRERGAPTTFDVYVVAYAWRGKAIGKAIDAYIAQLAGLQAEELVLDDGTELRAGGAAQVISYVGHNGWMDIETFDWSKRPAATSLKGTIAVTCMSAQYLAGPLRDSKLVPLLMTTSLLFAGAHSFEGAVSALAEAGTFHEIRHAAAANHAQGQGKAYRRVRGAFTNPSDKRWAGYIAD